MRKRFFHTPEFHILNHDKEKKVTWLELFYDLIYVAAFIQLGDTFAKNISIDYFFKSAGIFISMWLSWTGFTYYANRLTVDDFPHRIIVFLKMFCVGAMAMSIPNLLNGNYLIFGLSYSSSMMLLSLLHLRAFLQQKVGRDYQIFWGSVFLSVSLIWLFSLIFDQLYFIGWGIGALIVFVSPTLIKAREMNEFYELDFEHLSERYGLLTIIVLGESFVKVLSSLTAVGTGGVEILQASFALLLTCSVWWIYFDDIAGAELKKGKFSMVTWLFTHLPLQFAIVLIGVGIKKIVSLDINDVIIMKYAITLGGAIGVVLISTAIIDSVTSRKYSELGDGTRIGVRVLSGILIILLTFVSHSLTTFWFIFSCLFICLFQVLFDIFYSPVDISDKDETTPSHEFHKRKIHTKPETIKNSFNLNPIRKGLPNNYKKDLYFYFVEATWLQIFVALFFIYILSNVLFAGLYLLTPNSISNGLNSFSNAFFFSVQTMSTIGYGTLSPTGFYSNLIVTIEAVFGIVGVALITGMLFAKISRPSSKILFSEKMINSPINGKNAISFRVSNTRGNDIVEASMSFSVLIDEITTEGEFIRRVKDLKLVRKRTPFFRLSWLITHEIDETSPLYEIDLTSGKVVSFLANLVGHDGTYSSTIYAQKNYHYSDIEEGKYFEDIIEHLDDGRMLINYENFNKFKTT